MNTIVVRVIRPEEGKYLTQKELIGNDKREFSTVISLSEDDSPDNYIEVDESVKKEWEATHGE